MKPSLAEYKAARILSFVAGAIIALLPFHELLTTWAGSNFGHLDLLRIWKEIVITLACLPSALLVFRSKGLRTWFSHSWIVRLILAYTLLQFSLGAWALARHQVTTVALIYALIINLRFFAFFLVCLVAASYDGWLKAVWYKLLLAPAGLVIAFGLAQKFLLPYDFLKHFGYGPTTIPAYETVDSNLNFQRLQSSLRGANPLGAYLVIIIPAFGLMRSSLWRYLGVLTGLVVLYFTYSRSAWLGLIVLALVLACWYFRIKINLKAAVAVVAAVLIIVAAGLAILHASQSAQDTLLHTSKDSKNVSSNSQRAASLRTGWHDVTHQPLGRGPGTAGPASFRNSGHPARIAEDYFLQIGQEVGVIGVMMFAAINYLVGKELWLRRADNLALLLLASLVGISFINLVSHAWADDTLSLLWWGLAGICLAPVISKK